MIEDKLSRNERRRLEALAQAVQTHAHTFMETDERAIQVIVAAKRYDTFLRTGE